MNPRRSTGLGWATRGCGCDEPVWRPRDGAQGLRVLSPALILGVSVSVAPPIGQYHSTKLINVGTNRWSVKPELGLSRTYGKWVVEAMAGSGCSPTTRSSRGAAPANRIHLGHAVSSDLQVHTGRWLAADANYYTGEGPTINGRENIDLQRNSRIGATFSTAIGAGQAIRCP